jgi:hypothetical protein
LGKKKTEFSDYDESTHDHVIKSLSSEKDILLLEDDNSENRGHTMKLDEKCNSAINGFTGKGYADDSICDRFLSWIFMW